MNKLTKALYITTVGVLLLGGLGYRRNILENKDQDILESALIKVSGGHPTTSQYDVLEFLREIRTDPLPEDTNKGPGAFIYDENYIYPLIDPPNSVTYKVSRSPFRRGET